MAKKGRREYGTGSIYQRKDGMWIGTIENGWKADGARRRIMVSAKTEVLCKKRMRDKRNALELGADPDVSPRATLKSWAEKWLPLQERRLAPKAYATTASAVNAWIVPTIGHRRFDALRPADIRLVANAQREAGRKPSTQLRTHSVLMSMLKSARLEGYPVVERLLATPAPTGAGVSDRTDIPVADAVKLLEVCADLPHGSRWVAALLQGMRQGESLGLTWPQVDLDAGTIAVSWQLQPLPYNIARDRSSGFRVPDGYEARQLHGSLHLVRPKSKAGWRVIPLVPWMRTALAVWHDNAPTSPHGLVWPNPDGTPRTGAADAAEWKSIQTRAGVVHPGGRAYGVHEARHTTATLLLEAGVDPAVIVRILGHSTILTSRSYMHVNTAPVLSALESVAGKLQLGGG